MTVTGSKWDVVVGDVGDRGNPAAVPVPTVVFEGDEDGARAAFADWCGKAKSLGYRYVLLRCDGVVIEYWGTPPPQ